MSAPHLDIAVTRYDNTRPLFEGTVRFDDVDAVLHSPPIPEIFAGVASGRFDVAELGLTHYLRALDVGTDLTAIPVFPARIFRHSSVFVNTAKGITGPADLAGRTIGEYGMYGQDAGIWIKGIMADDFDFVAEDNRWVVGGLDTPLFVDPEREERDWHRRTGIFPIMHTIVVRRALLDDDPDLARRLYAGFLDAKDTAAGRYRDMRRLFQVTTMVPWMHSLVERNRDAFDDDWFPYGVAANRTTLERFLNYSSAQGLSSADRTVDELFAEELAAS